LKKQQSVSSPTNENPFGVAARKPAAASSSNENDLFGLDLTGLGSVGDGSSTAPQSASNGKSLDDLFSLQTPTASSIPNPFMGATAAPTIPSAFPPVNMMNPMPGMGVNPFQMQPQQPIMMMQQPNYFAAQSGFSNSNKNISKSREKLIHMSFFFIRFNLFAFNRRDSFHNEQQFVL
jgi:hypothetical protein